MPVISPKGLSWGRCSRCPLSRPSPSSIRLSLGYSEARFRWCSAIQGLSSDGWAGAHVVAIVQAQEPVNRVIIAGELTHDFGEPFAVTLRVNDVRVERSLPLGPFLVEAQTRLGKGDIARIAITSDKTWCPQEIGLNTDTRHLSFTLELIAFLREKKPAPADAGPSDDRSPVAHSAEDSRVEYQARLDRRGPVVYPPRSRCDRADPADLGRRLGLSNHRS